MTQENITELRQNVVTGYGFRPWHFVQGESPEPYELAVPEDAAAALFPTIALAPIKFTIPTSITDEGVTEAQERTSPNRVVIYRTDTGDDLGTAKDGFQPHQYTETLLGLGLPIASAGILKGGAVAWTQFGLPDSVTTKENVRFIPKLLGQTSADGSVASSFRNTIVFTQCDNTLALANQNSTNVKSVRHTKFSLPRVEDLRKQFSLLDQYAEEAALSIDALIAQEVTSAQVDQFLAELFPASVAKIGKEAGEVTKTAHTFATNARDKYQAQRAGMWSDHANDAFGILQAADSFLRWDSQLKGIDRYEKVNRGIISGAFDKEFTKAQKILERVLVTV